MRTAEKAPGPLGEGARRRDRDEMGEVALLAPILALLTGPCSDGGHKAAFYADFRHPLALTKVNLRLGAFRWNREVRHPRAPEYF